MGRSFVTAVVLSPLLHNANEVAEMEARASPIDVAANGLFFGDLK